MNNRYKAIIDIECKKLISAFEDSKILFENQNVRNNLIHAGEYGAYRERALKKFLSFILSRKFDFGEGFVINSFNETTAQCDIIIYDKLKTPLIEVDSTTRFFPCETVFAIGEVKSKITKTQLFDYLMALSKKKEIKKISTKFSNIFSFLVCESVDGFNMNLGKKIEEFYNSKKIPPCLRHNAILSLKDGLSGYTISEDNITSVINHSNCSNNDIEKLKKMIGVISYMPSEGFIDFPPLVSPSSENNFNNIQLFFASLSNYLENCTCEYPEPASYLF